MVTRTHLECAGLNSDLPHGVGLLGSLFFIGAMVSFFLWVKITERGWARKPIILLGATLQGAAFAGIIFLSVSFQALQLYYFVLGVGSVLSICTSYNYLNEFTPNHSKIIVSTLYLSFQIFPAVLLPPFLALINEDVYPFLFMGLGVSLLGLFLTLTSLPESPHFLFSTNNFMECQASLNYIARFNRVREGGPNFVDLTDFMQNHQ